mmetsp:Transcript_2890/g.9008  ORF Transcript_2890/g.9008 Transcript_2890/m.9008 type:complete len:258 (-) Transcript_2890:66-839(-)
MSTSAGPQAQKISGGGSAAWTPTGGRTVFVERLYPGSTDFRLSVMYDPRESSKKSNRKKVNSLHPDYPGAPGFLGTGKMKRWTTEEAARAAIPHFRDWVDGGARAICRRGGRGRRGRRPARPAAALLEAAQPGHARPGRRLPRRHGRDPRARDCCRAPRPRRIQRGVARALERAAQRHRQAARRAELRRRGCAGRRRGGCAAGPTVARADGGLARHAAQHAAARGGARPDARSARPPSVAGCCVRAAGCLRERLCVV